MKHAYVHNYFSFADHPSLPSARQVEKFQEKGYQELRSYIGLTFPENNDRFPKLLLRYNLFINIFVCAYSLVFILFISLYNYNYLGFLLLS